MIKPILCLDFDGVLHSYISGWSPGGKVSDAQFKRVYAIRAAGGLAGIAESVEDAKRIIEG